MKLIVSILLLIITTAYIIPAKDLFQTESYEYCVEKMDVEKEKEDIEKKDKKKDFFLRDIESIVSISTSTKKVDTKNYKLQSVLHTVETPPPNKI